jgi:hypothetical protein
MLLDDPRTVALEGYVTYERRGVALAPGKATACTGGAGYPVPGRREGDISATHDVARCATL